MTNGGLSITITRESQGTFDIDSNTGNLSGRPASWGTRSLDPFVDLSATAFVINFSSPVFFFQVEFGDGGGDSDSLVLQAYDALNASGTLLGTTNTDYGANSFPSISTASVTASGIQSIRMLGGSVDIPHSVFYDNILANTTIGVPVPEPSSLLLLLSGATLMALRRYKLSR